MQGPLDVQSSAQEMDDWQIEEEIGSRREGDEKRVVWRGGFCDEKFSLEDEHETKWRAPRAYNPCTSHALFVTLRQKYGLAAISRRKGSANVVHEDESSAEGDNSGEEEVED